MSGMWGNNIKLSIFGESHGDAIGITIDGLPPGVEIDMDEVKKEMSRRAPGKNSMSTQRRENDEVSILSGYFENKTTGTPLCAIIKNNNTKSKDYSIMKDIVRPSHADYPGKIKYRGFNDYRGGGHFSGRITAPLVFAGAICKQILYSKGIHVISHINSIGNIKDKSFLDCDISDELINSWEGKDLPVISSEIEIKMKNEILKVKENQDSIGGTIECVVLGLKAGIGSPFFDSIESTLAHLIFSVPAVKGIEFGSGFDISKMTGSQANDEYYIKDDKVKTSTNNNGGILGGISNGMPIVFNVAIKPTPSIYIEQNTINLSTMKETRFSIEGRHDPCIVQRALPVIEGVTAIGILDLLMD